MILFRDKVIGRKPPPPVRPRVNLPQNNLARLEFENGNRARPIVHLDKKLLQELYVPWQDAFVIKLLGKSIGYLMLRDRLKTTWKLKGGFDRRDVGNGFYMVNFDTLEDRSKVIEEGPWIIFDHYLAV